MICLDLGKYLSTISPLSPCLHGFKAIYVTAVYHTCLHQRAQHYEFILWQAVSAFQYVIVVVHQITKSSSADQMSSWDMNVLNHVNNVNILLPNRLHILLHFAPGSIFELIFLQLFISCNIMQYISLKGWHMELTLHYNSQKNFLMEHCS